jgi:transcriptional regulator with XRE-family HTH domain
MTMIDEEVARRLRAAREKQDISIRELARRLAMSPSAISQIETGRTRPSVATLFAMVTELRVSMDEIFGHAVETRSGREGESGVVVRRGERLALNLGTGVRWERLTPKWDPDVEFIFVEYEAGGASPAEGELLRHQGRQYGLVLTGSLEVAVAFETYRLTPGDSIAFDSTVPHRISNAGLEPATAVWFTVGRSGDGGGRRWPASVEWGSAAEP